MIKLALDGHKTFVTIFPDLMNYHLIKDVGMIPYLFGKKYGYRSIIVTYPNDEYKFLQTILKGLSIYFLSEKKPQLKEQIQHDIREFLTENAKVINILNIYDISIANLKYINLYKKVNKTGTIYLKLDRGMNYTLNRHPYKYIRDRFIELSLRKCELISIESRMAQRALTKHTLLKTVYIPNGYYDFHHPEFLKKKKQILFVGDVSITPKRIDLLVSAFNVFSEKMHNEYELHIVGPLKNDFLKWLSETYVNDSLPVNIKICDAIYDREILQKKYSESMFFVLPSDHESFGIVLVEAARFGCIPIASSGIPSAYDITNEEKYGYVFNKGSREDLVNKLLLATTGYSDLYVKEMIDFIEKEFSWNSVVDRIADNLQIKAQGNHEN